MNRRTFLSFSAGATAGMMITPIPWKLTDDISIWTQNWKWNPKVPNRAVYFAEMASKIDPSGAGVRVALIDGIPVGVAGNSEHPLSKGGVSSVAAAESGLYFSPSRVKQPMLKTESGYTAISWEKAEKLLSEKLGAAQDKVVMVSGDDTGSANEIFAALVKGLGGSYYMMPGDAQSAAKACEKMGVNGQIAYDIENSDHVLMLGADSLESSGTTVRNARAFSESHPTGKQAVAKYVYAGPVQNNTATVCDQWIQAKPGSAATVALGIAHELMAMGASADNKGLGKFAADVASAYTPARVERETGVRASSITKMAKELAAASRPLVIGGSEFGRGTRALMASMAVNSLLGRVNAQGGVKVVPEAPVVVEGAPSATERYSADLVPFLKNVASGREKAEVLMVYDANPAYALPEADVMAKAMEKAGFTVSFNSFMDETTERADLIMPNSMAVERYDDVYTPYGAASVVYSVNRPVAKRAFDTRTTADVMLSVASSLGKDLGFASFRDVLKAKAVAMGADWGSLRKGVAWTTAAKATGSLNLSACAAPAPAAVGNGMLAMAPVVRQNLGTAKIAMPPHNANTIKSDELIGTHTALQMNAKTARKAGVKAGQTVNVSGAGGQMTAKVHVTEKVMTGVVAAPLGFGHTAWDGFTKNVGDNTFRVIAAAEDSETGLSAWDANLVNIATA